MVAMAMLALIVSNGIAVGGMPVFFKSVQADLIASGAVRAEEIQSSFSIGPALTIMLAGFLAPLGGYLIDRIGTKWVMVIGCLLLGSGLFVYTRAGNLNGVYLAHALMGASLCFIGVVPCSSLVSKWFDRYRGAALGIALTSTNFGAILIPQIAAPLIASDGWRTAMLYTSALVWVVLLPAVLLLVKDPKQGLEVAVDLRAPSSDGVGLRGALTSVSFWILALCAALIFYAIFAVLQQFNLYMQSPKLGYDLGGVKVFMSSLALWSVFGKFGTGLIADRLGAVRSLIVTASVMFVSTLLLLDVGPWAVGVFAAVFGLGYGGTFVILQMIAADLFGKREFPRILGALHFIQTSGGAIGLLATGYIADANGGDFTLAFRVLIGIMGGAILLAIALQFRSRKFLQ